MELPECKTVNIVTAKSQMLSHTVNDAEKQKQMAVLRNHKYTFKIFFMSVC